MSNEIPQTSNRLTDATMDKQAFETTRRLVEAAGLEILDSRYDRQSFGSWFITAQTIPPLRIVWDGRDSYLYVQQESFELAHGSPLWNDCWMSKNPADQNPENAAAQLLLLVKN